MCKTFDAVQWMRQARARIDEEDRELTWEQKRRKTHEAIMGDPILARLAGEARIPGESVPAMAREESVSYEGTSRR
jgi:hypothetical protein